MPPSFWPRCGRRPLTNRRESTSSARRAFVRSTNVRLPSIVKKRKTTSTRFARRERRPPSDTSTIGPRASSMRPSCWLFPGVPMTVATTSTTPNRATTLLRVPTTVPPMAIPTTRTCIITVRRLLMNITHHRRRRTAITEDPRRRRTTIPIMANLNRRHHLTILATALITEKGGMLPPHRRPTAIMGIMTTVTVATPPSFITTTLLHPHRDESLAPNPFQEMPRAGNRTKATDILPLEELHRPWITAIQQLADIITVLTSIRIHIHIRPSLLLTAITTMGGTVSTILHSSLLLLRMRRRFTNCKQPGWQLEKR
mmetsp:Transcript_21135/g.60608  ORF Transcript_21135/g.60608 Transcript_21135/m.60608 type:complete len:313 (-) Transcript_21135:84-1022(-)